MQVQAVRFTDLHYFLSQTYDAFLDGILHDKRLAEHAERITVARAAAFLSGAVVGSVVCSIPCLLLVAPYGQTLSHKWIAPALGRFLHVLSELPVAGGSYKFLRIGLPPWSVTGAGPVTLESRSGIGHSHYFGCDRQSEMKRCTLSVVRRGPQTATMGLDN